MATVGIIIIIIIAGIQPILMWCVVSLATHYLVIITFILCYFKYYTNRKHPQIYYYRSDFSCDL